MKTSLVIKALTKLAAGVVTAPQPVQAVPAAAAIARPKVSKTTITPQTNATPVASSPVNTEVSDDEYVNRVNAAIDSVVPFIQKHEAFVPKAYRKMLRRDEKGNPVYDKWTIGYGQTEINGRPVAEGDTITEAEALKFLKKRVRHNAALMCTQNPWTRKLTSDQLAPLYDVAYNMGVGTLADRKGASPRLNKAMREATSGFSDILRRELPTYKFFQGKQLQGLINRRNDAIAKWLPQ